MRDISLAAGVCTGLQFAPVTPTRLELAIARAIALRGDGTSWKWRRMQSRAMATDVSWTRPAKQYAQLFQDLVASRAQHRTDAAASQETNKPAKKAMGRATRSAD